MPCLITLFALEQVDLSGRARRAGAHTNMACSVYILGATGLAKADILASDPFCLVYWRDELVHRTAVQQKWMADEVQVICATVCSATSTSLTHSLTHARLTCALAYLLPCLFAYLFTY